jgi:regulator of replication initiation timing
LGATLNWRRDPDYEQRMNAKLTEIEQIKARTKQIEKETEQLRRENAKQRALSALIKQHCFPAESNSTPIPPIEPDSSSS